MHHFLPILLADFYKIGHPFQYPRDLVLCYSNQTPRASRVGEVEQVLHFGPQYYVEEYLMRRFRQDFFEVPENEVLRQYRRVVESGLGKGAITFDHIQALHQLQYLPMLIKSLPEGMLVPLRVPTMTMRNTHKDFGWLTNSLETLQSNILWLPPTSATTAFRYRKTFEDYAKKTGASREFVKWQGHDFSMRGMAGIEAACLSAAGHALSFYGSDTVPVIPFFEEYYGADCETDLIVGSVPATEHSVVCVGTSVWGDEDGLLTWLLTSVYPTGILSYVSDTTDFWSVLTKTLPRLRELILSRQGKLVIRPDSGDPVLIICGDPNSSVPWIRKGAIQVLWEIFGGTVNSSGYKELDSHIGLIYGDSITPERQLEILFRLAAKGFASSNVVLGIGSYTYQYVTRDTYGWAIKATFAETESGGGKEIFKAPRTDSGLKNSAKGLLAVEDHGYGLVLHESCSWEQEQSGLLQPIFEDSQTYNKTNLIQMRQRVEAYL